MREKKGYGLKILAFLAPVLILYTAFFLYPLVFTAWTSLMKWKGIGSMSFYGLQNYVKLLSDPTFRLSIRNNMVWAAALGFIQVPLACLVALILVRQPKGWKLLRTLYYLPNVISTVALAMVWVAMYNPLYGPLNAILKTLGFQARNWLGDPATSLMSIIGQSVLYIGYFMIIILAAAMEIPVELFEAAQMDGATVFQQNKLITLPMIRGTLVTSVTLAMAFGMRHFESTFLMTQGGPAFSTSTMGIMLFLKMDALRYGEASAVGMILILLGTVAISLIRKLLEWRDPLWGSGL
ncbi:MAG: sugar ABC transporter permease [Spirochaetes bacterium]|nr:sugar ABC transporter permease [Spirochaetota bacterium]